MTQARYYTSVATKTSLNGTISPTALTMVVASASGFPVSFPYALILERDSANEEIVDVTAASGTTLTVTRGVDGTAGITHTVGATVEHGTSARDFTEAGVHVGNSGIHGARSFRVVHTFALPASIGIAATPSFFVPLTGSQTATLVGARCVIGSGTSVTFDLQRNGSGVSGATGIVVTTTAATTTFSRALTADDALRLNITALSGLPQDLTVSLYMDIVA